MTSYHDYEGAEHEYPPHEEEPLTNEEYIRTCSTEELAEALLEIYKDGINDYKTDWWEDSKEDWLEWLKEKHHE